MGNGEQGDRRRQEERIRPRKEVEPQLVAQRGKKGRSSRRRVAVQFLALPQWFVQPSEQRWKPAQSSSRRSASSRSRSGSSSRSRSRSGSSRSRSGRSTASRRKSSSSSRRKSSRR